MAVAAEATSTFSYFSRNCSGSSGDATTIQLLPTPTSLTLQTLRSFFYFPHCKLRLKNCRHGLRKNASKNSRHGKMHAKQPLIGEKYKQFFLFVVSLFVYFSFCWSCKRLAAQTIFCINFNFGPRFSPIVCSAVSRYCVLYLLVDSRHSFYLHLVSSPACSHCAFKSADAGSRMNILL